jgi:hypothetical protein
MGLLALYINVGDQNIKGGKAFSRSTGVDTVTSLTWMVKITFFGIIPLTNMIVNYNTKNVSEFSSHIQYSQFVEVS